MKKLQANVSYSLIHGSMWGMYAIIFAFATNFLEKYHLGAGQMSLVLGGTAAASCLLNVVIGELVSRIRQLKMYMATLIVAALILAGLGLMLSRSMFLGLAGISMVLALLQLVPGMCNSIGMDAIAKGAPATYSIARGVGSLFYALSATFIGVLVSSFGLDMIPIVTAILGACMVCGVLWFHFCAEKGLEETVAQEKGQDKAGNFLSKNPKFAAFLVGATLLCISHFLVCTFMKQIVENIQLGATEQGIATGISAFVELPIMFGFVLISKKFRCHSMLKVAAFMFIAKSMGLLLARDAMGIYLAQATQIVGYGLYAITSVTYAGQVMGKAEAVRAQSYLAATISLGNVIAMFSGGFLLEAIGVGGMLLTATGCALGGALVILFSAEKAETEV